MKTNACIFEIDRNYVYESKLKTRTVATFVFLLLSRYPPVSSAAVFWGVTQRLRDIPKNGCGTPNNRSSSIYQYSNMQSCLSVPKKTYYLDTKKTPLKYRNLSWNPRSHAAILIHQECFAHNYIPYLYSLTDLFYTFSGRVSRIAITHATLQSLDREGLGTVEQNHTSTDTWLVLSTLPPHSFIITGILERSPFSLKEFEHVAKYWASTICWES